MRAIPSASFNSPSRGIVSLRVDRRPRPRLRHGDDRVFLLEDDRVRRLSSMFTAWGDSFFGALRPEVSRTRTSQRPARSDNATGILFGIGAYGLWGLQLPGRRSAGTSSGTRRPSPTRVRSCTTAGGTAQSS